ncbi:MAG: ion channel, partial [Gammaproteobacteria bacterium]
MRVIPLGLHSSPLHDFYHRLLKTTWPRFFLIVAIAYFGTDFLFGLVYWLSNGLEPQPISLADAFFFSVQMLTTGYGDVYAHSLFANWAATLEPFVGLLGFALVTGVTFARISQPTARIQFSKNALVNNFHGKPTLMFRMANQRHNHIVEAEVHLVLARDE